MRTEQKINRKFLTYLLWLEVKKVKIAELLDVSRKTLFTYLDNFPITEDEFRSVAFDRKSLEEVAMNSFDENGKNKPIQKSSRLPETKFGVCQNTAQKQKESLPEKIKQKSSSQKSLKKDDDESEDDDVSFLMELSNNLAEQAKRFNK